MINKLGLLSSVTVTPTEPLKADNWYLTLDASIKLALKKNTEQQKQSKIKLDVKQAYEDWKASYASMRTLIPASESATEALRLSRLRFQAGVGTTTDIFNAETSFRLTESDRDIEILDHNRAVAKLRQVIGISTNIFDKPEEKSDHHM